MKSFKIDTIFRFISCLFVLSFNLVQGQISAQHIVLTTEQQLLDETHVQEIENLYDKGEDGFFNGENDIEVYYKIFKQNSGQSPAIVISSGRTEAAIKYKELIFDLYNHGFSVYIFDHRGQGQSGRMTEDSSMGYIDDFQYYIDDMKTFYDLFVMSGNHQKHFLLAHSMGGAIGMTYLEQYPKDYNSAAFSSPMLGLKTGVCGGAKLLEPEVPKYGLGEGKYSEDKNVFKKNTLTGSEIRYNRMVSAFKIVPEARLGGATYQWVVESCEQFKFIDEHVNDIETPFLIFSAQNEEIVSLKAHIEFIEEAKRLNKDCKLVFIENAQHELLIEKDPQRTQTLQNIISFYTTNSN